MLQDWFLGTLLAASKRKGLVCSQKYLMVITLNTRIYCTLPSISRNRSPFHLSKHELMPKQKKTEMFDTHPKLYHFSSHLGIISNLFGFMLQVFGNEYEHSRFERLKSRSVRRLQSNTQTINAPYNTYAKPGPCEMDPISCPCKRNLRKSVG